MTIQIKHFKRIGSTNDFALEELLAGRVMSDIAVIADEQTNGRGRLNGRVWNSPKGNFYCTYVLDLKRLNVSASETNIMTAEVMNVLQLYLRQMTNSDKVVLKHPNDILVNGKKLAGVLTEISYPYAVIGIGINLINSPLEIATSIKTEFNLLVNPRELAENLYESIINELRKCHFH